MNKRNSGFSLIELMVVVSIIAILASIAIPNFSNMSARVKQTSAKVELSGIYTAEHSWYSMYDEYHPNLAYIGYAPDAWATFISGSLGGPSPTEGCPTTGSFSPRNKRFYRVGFIGIADGPAQGESNYVTAGWPPLDATRGCLGTGNGRTYFDKSVFVPGTLDWTVAGTMAAGATPMAPAAAFTAVAEGNIKQNTPSDIWNINQTKTLTNFRSGL